MHLAEGLLEWIAINGAFVSIDNDDGSKTPLAGPELIDEIARRLAGLTITRRLSVDQHSPAEALSSLRAESLAETERLQKALPVEIKMPSGDWRRQGPGRPPRQLQRVINEIIAGKNAGRWTKNKIADWTQDALEAEFRCHHSVVERALALIHD
jgi:hypothetical protein